MFMYANTMGHPIRISNKNTVRPQVQNKVKDGIISRMRFGKYQVSNHSKKRLPSGRSFSRVFCSLITIILILAGGCGRLTPAAAEPPAIVKQASWTEVGKDIFVFTSQFYLANMTLVTSGKQAVLVDTGMDASDGQKIKDFLKARNLTLQKIVITHMHGDHNGNLSVLSYPNIATITPDQAQANQTFKVGEKTLKLIYTEGHFAPKGHISVEIGEAAKDKILIAGDVICNNILPPLASGGEIKPLLATLDQLQKQNYTVVIPGHGEIAATDLIFARQFEYLNSAKQQVEKLIAAGGSKADTNNIKLEDCLKDTSYLYTERLEYWHQQNLQTMYDQLK